MVPLNDHNERPSDQTVEPALSSSRRRSRGQALVELAITIPVILLIVLGALDMGRAFMGWVVLNNAARVGANYAAANPEAWGTPGNAAQRGVYQQLVIDARADAAATLAGCADESVSAPHFPSGRDISDFAVVELECGFTPLIPFIGEVLAGPGNAIPVSARSVFPIRSGGIVVPPSGGGTGCTSEIGDVSVDDMTVTFADATTGSPTAWVWLLEGAIVSAVQNPVHTYTTEATHTVQLTATVGGVQCTPDEVEVTVPGSGTIDDMLCTTPGLIGEKQKSAQAIWQDDNGFSTEVQLAAGASSTANWDIQSQSINALQEVPCNSIITIGPDPVLP